MASLVSLTATPGRSAAIVTPVPHRVRYDPASTTSKLASAPSVHDGNVIRFSSPRVAFSGARGYVLMLPGMRFAPDVRAEPYARTVPDPFDEQ